MRQKISYGFRFIKVICLLVLDFMIKKKKKGYILSLADYFKSINLGVLPFAKGNTDECLICEIKFDEDKKTTIKNKVLKDAIENKSPDDNPILCLIKAKQ